MRCWTTGALALAVACSAPPRLDSLRERLRMQEEPPGLVVLENAEVDLPVPRAVRARSGELREVPLTWDPVLAGDVAGYRVERAPADEEVWKPIASVAGRFHSGFVDRGDDLSPLDGDPERLSDGTTYRYRVRSVDSQGRPSRDTSLAVAATTAPLPGPPAGLRAYSHLPREVALTWEASEDASVAGYIVMRSPSGRGPFESIARTEGRFETRYLDGGLGDLRVLYYRVAGYNTAGAVGAPAEPVVAVTKPEPLPPMGLRVVEKRLGENELAWEPNLETKIAGYRLLRSRETGANQEVVGVYGPETLSARDTSVGAGETVHYTLVAYDRDGLESAPTDPLQVNSEGYHLRARAEDGAVELRWSPSGSSRFTSARILRQGFLGRRELARVEADTYVDREVEAGAIYRYVVVLVSPDGREAPPSEPVEVRVPEAGAASVPDQEAR